MAYTHRDRVMTALNLEEPDRVPVDLMGHASMLLDGTYERLRDYLGLSPIPPVRAGTSANYYDERILEYLEVDYRRIFLKTRPEAALVVHEDGTFTDAWKICSYQLGLFIDVMDYPLAEAETVEDVEAYNWPTADYMFTAAGLSERARQMYEDTDYALVARNPLSYGFRERACMLMPMDKFLMFLVLKPDVVECMVSRLLEVYQSVYGMFLDAVGPYVQVVEVGDDLGSMQNLLISEKMYRAFFKPAEKQLYELIHRKAPKAKLIRHSDGAFFTLIPDLIEIGVDVLNPVQASAKGMDPRILKENFGDKLAFHGGIENVEGEVSVDQVVAEVKSRIDALAPGGGYVVSSCNHMLDVKPEVIIAMFETAREYGQYK